VLLLTICIGRIPSTHSQNFVSRVDKALSRFAEMYHTVNDGFVPLQIITGAVEIYSLVEFGMGCTVIPCSQAREGKKIFVIGLMGLSFTSLLQRKRSFKGGGLIIGACIGAGLSTVGQLFIAGMFSS